jgi:hypothetical protein
MTARIRAVCRQSDGRLVLHADRFLHLDTPMLVGREGDIGVGVSPVDAKVSRHALRVVRTAHGWQVTVTNRNGVIAQPWGQPPGIAEPDTLLAWPRVALRVIGSPEYQHWVLLDDPALALRRPSPPRGTHLTETADQPRPLTVSQELAMRALFAELLAWPPVIPATPRQIKQVAARLGVRTESIQRRLEEVRKKARAVGHARVGLLTDPEYLYVLIRAGYVQPADEDLHPLLRALPPDLA